MVETRAKKKREQTPDKKVVSKKLLVEQPNELQSTVNGDVEKMDDTKPSQNELDLLTCEDIRDYVRLIEKGVSTKEARFVYRALRNLIVLRSRINTSVLYRCVHTHFSEDHRQAFVQFLDKAANEDFPVLKSPKPGRDSKTSHIILPEVEMFFYLLIMVSNLDKKNFELAKRCSDAMLESQSSYKRRTLDPVLARCFFFYALIYEKMNCFADIRSRLHQLLKSSSLNRNDECTATLINILLRNYIHYNLYEQAENLLKKTNFPKNASNHEWARYLYYLGRIKAVHLEYSEARRNLVEASRKAPQMVAIGFRQQVAKLTCVVELLIGEIPERATFRQKHLKKPLKPYLALTNAIRHGNLTMFNEVVAANTEKFTTDGTVMLITRLRHNVIKAGIKKINTSYSCISLDEVAVKLGLDSATDALYTVAKAIKDGVIEAKIDYQNGCIRSKCNPDIYSSFEPSRQFQSRITFLLDIHRQAVTALRYPPKAYNKDLESLEERREREQQDIEIAKELAEDDDDDLGFP